MASFDQQTLAIQKILTFYENHGEEAFDGVEEFVDVNDDIVGKYTFIDGKWTFTGLMSRADAYNYMDGKLYVH